MGTLKTMGLTLMAMLAVSVISPVAAHGDAQATLGSGSAGGSQFDLEAEGNEDVLMPGKKVTCKKLDGHAPHFGEATSLTATDIGITECNTVILGFINVPTTVKPAANCHFTFTAGTYTETHNDADGSVHICAMTITLYTSAAHMTTYCEIHVPAQTITNLTFANAIRSGQKAVTATAISSMEVTITDHNTTGCTTHESVNAIYDGSFWLYLTNGEEELVDVEVTDKP